MQIKTIKLSEGKSKMYTEQEIEHAELVTEDIFCKYCNISGGEKDCSSCEAFYRIRDMFLHKKWGNEDRN